MYKKVAQMVPVTTKYERQLVGEGVLSQEEVDGMKNKIKSQIEKAYAVSKSYKFNVEDWKNNEWEEIKIEAKYGEIKNT